MVSVRLIEISKNFAEIEILKNINWEIQEGELMILVGPSGSGKTTLLKIILGSLKPDTGKILFNKELINEISISKRNIGFVPQNFGLFPHLNVHENISFGMKIRKFPQDKVSIQVSKLIKMLRLGDLEQRMPNQLSWGQQQRVALARALAIEPKLLLLDEPLSSVDWVARQEIVEEISRLQKRLEITTIYVTHEINEAFEIGDRITVMNAGKIEQSSLPEDLIKNPKSEFVSSYIGHNRNIQKLKSLMRSD